MSFELTIIIPVYNEVVQLKKKLNDLRAWQCQFKERIQIIVIDSNSSDQSSDIFNIITLEKLAEIHYLKQAVDDMRSIGVALRQACEFARAPRILILPVDVFISTSQIEQVIYLSMADLSWGCFLKKYNVDSAIMLIYASAQNLIRTMLLHQAVWTNAIFFNRHLKSEISTAGFLEDVLFCDRLKLHSKGIIFKDAVVVDSRKYQADGLKKRIFLNGMIMLFFRLGYNNIFQLKKLYQGHLSFFEFLKKIVFRKKSV